MYCKGSKNLIELLTCFDTIKVPTEYNRKTIGKATSHRMQIVEFECNFMTINIYYITGITRPYVCVCWFLECCFLT